MNYLLDTNAVIAVMKGNPKVLGRLRLHSAQDVCLSSIVVHELYFGAYKSQRIDANLARIDALQFPIIDFDREDARCAGELRAVLVQAGTPVGPYDALIAGQALARNLTLVTRNTREFARAVRLVIEDWES